MQGYVTIDSVVRSVIADEGKTLHYYLDYLHQALQGEEEWRRDYGMEVVTKKLLVNADLTVDFPKDLLSWSKIGVLVGDRIVAFVNDNTLISDPECLEHPRQPFNEVYDNVKGDYYDFLNFSGGQLTAPSYGMKLPGYFVADERKRRFVLSDEVKAKEVYLEYVPEGCDASTQTYVAKVAVNLLKNYIKWKYAKNRIGPESSRARAWEREYLNEKDTVIGRLNPISYNDILEISRRHYTTTPRS